MKNLKEMNERLHLEGVDVGLERERIARYLSGLHNRIKSELCLDFLWEDEQNKHELAHVDETIRRYPGLSDEAKNFMNGGVDIRSVWGYEDGQQVWSTVVDIPQEVLIREPEFGLEVARAPLLVGSELSKEDSRAMILCLGVMSQGIPWLSSVTFVPEGSKEARVMWKKEATPLVITEQHIRDVLRKHPYINPDSKK